MLGGIAFTAGRVIFAAVLGFMGFSHFMDVEGMSGYAEAKGVPFPKLAVIGSGIMLVLGSLSIALGVYPIIGAGLIAVFLLGVTPVMHDFWIHEDPEERQNEMISFEKNTAMFGAALLIMAISGTSWPYALNIGL